MSQRARDDLIEQLRKMVVTCELAPGSSLSERYLLDKLECGRSPLREALQILSHDYLVVLPPRRGIIIPELSIVDFRDAHEALLFIDLASIDRAVSRMSRQQLEQMEDTIERQVRGREAADFYLLAELDRQFHSLIVAASGNAYLTHFGSRLRTILERFVYRAYQEIGVAPQALAEHREIIEALAASEVELARQRLREHSVVGRHRVLLALGVGEDALSDF